MGAPIENGAAVPVKGEAPLDMAPALAVDVSPASSTPFPTGDVALCASLVTASGATPEPLAAASRLAPFRALSKPPLPPAASKLSAAPRDSGIAPLAGAAPGADGNGGCSWDDDMRG